MRNGTQSEIDNARRLKDSTLLPFDVKFISTFDETDGKIVTRSDNTFDTKSSVYFIAEDGDTNFLDFDDLRVVEENSYYMEPEVDEPLTPEFKTVKLWADELETKFTIDWEVIGDGYNYRSKVFGGWLVKVLEDVVHLDSTIDSRFQSRDGYDWRIAMAFVPDPKHEWTV